MNILFKNVQILDKYSSLNGKKKDLGVVNGKITFKTKDLKFSKTPKTAYGKSLQSFVTSASSNPEEAS